MPHLRSLDLSGCPLTSLPKEIGRLKELRTLDLSDTQLTDLPDDLRELSSLVELRVQRTSIPAARIATLAAVLPKARVIASAVRLTSMEEALRDPEHAVSLDLSRRGLTSLPPEIARLTELETLRVSDNQLAAFPEAIVHLPRLHELWLAKNRIRTLPAEICRIPIRYLTLDENGLSRLPNDMSGCQSLRSLSLNRNRLHDLPPDLERLPELRSLSLDENDFTREEFTSIRRRFSKIRIADYRPRTYRSLDEALANPDRVIRLDLAGAGLSALPAGIGALRNLETLDLSGNKLVKLPAEMQNLRRLQLLVLALGFLSPETREDLRRWLPGVTIRVAN